MAVPTKPANLANGAVLPESWCDDVTDLLGWFRDDRPLFKGQTATSLSANDTDSGITATQGFGVVASTFDNTPDINVGGWVVESAGSLPFALLVPEAGIYRVTIHASWEGDADGRRQNALLVNGSAVAASRARILTVGSGIQTEFTVTTLVDLAANDTLEIQAFQNSGNTIACTSYLTAEWVQST